ncbi:MAG: hypothetical protein Q7T49_00600 [bacterium]|nr:hypothetical protein [bacterium]
MANDQYRIRKIWKKQARKIYPGLVAQNVMFWCVVIEGLDTDSSKNASTAAYLMGLIEGILSELFEDFGPAVFEEALEADRNMGFDQEHQRSVLGVDFGYTISWPNVRDGQRLLIHEDADFLSREFVEGAPEAVKTLVKVFGPAYVYIVSKCEEAAEARIMEWLDAKEFWYLTGMKRENVRFCRERHQKFEICLELGITHFVDDRREVLHYLRGVGTKIALNPRDDDPDEVPFTQAPIMVARNWPQVKNLILGSFNPTPSLCTK